MDLKNVDVRGSAFKVLKKYIKLVAMLHLGLFEVEFFESVKFLCFAVFCCCCYDQVFQKNRN